MLRESKRGGFQRIVFEAHQIGRSEGVLILGL